MENGEKSAGLNGIFIYNPLEILSFNSDEEESLVSSTPACETCERPKQYQNINKMHLRYRVIEYVHWRTLEY